MITAGVYRTRSDAELAQALLRASGIRSEIEADDAGAAYPFDLSGGARLIVQDADADSAAALLSNRPTDTRKEHQ